ncbi:hypothetical protein N5F23_16180 [Pseudomonas sichuanensis]|uniref:DUF6543 domain-containing protein n=1 Tax=Pseudomonas sichuanensis TaxID=2213015 RepID=UPI0024494964|nr:DUF6543 domain-containing protein [Pseudomonas sichuanensis]MDH0731914.1 hypothetical protein [Pseudomonas sichuanensis]MDH1584115.1 hypothetical protein [Pseudomonas sichuanensis]MDH1593006.1 hypothetical protein [Pseudomonas sichuanensis]MDH1598964.1 hypothetical protein [Pseudomonas sichuanensis]
MDLHQRIVALSTLDCTVARRFQDRPVLHAVAGRLLVEQWQQRQLGHAHDPLALYLISRPARGAQAWIRPLSMTLIERFCRRATLNLTEGEDFISSHPVDDPTRALKIDLHPVEVLINECGPFVVERHREELVQYWSTFDSNGQTPWQWYARYLEQQLGHAIDSRKDDGRLTSSEIDLANQLRNLPGEAGQHSSSTITHLLTDLSDNGKIDLDLGSALLLEHGGDTPVTLLYTLVGKLLAFPSRRAMLDIIARLWPESPIPGPHKVQLAPTADVPFEIQALGLLHQQLQVLHSRSQQYFSQGHALALSHNLDRLTSMVELCNRDERRQRKTLAQRLPDWLQKASDGNQLHYARMLVDVAQGYKDAQGRFWLDGIDTAQAYANRQLALRLTTDHPDNNIDPQDIRVINLQTHAGALAGQDNLIITGTPQRVEFSLADLAIGNLGLLKPGRVELSASDGASLPAWLNRSYIERIVSELDIGRSYPAMLRDKLLDDAAGKRERQALLGAQLRNQLPALAMELHLRDQGISKDCVERVGEIFTPAVEDDAEHWVLRPLGLLRRTDAAPDMLLNTWLIEAASPEKGPCLLYRPLHAQPLQQFDDRLALLVAMGTPGELQDDLLARLPAEARRVYDHGGITEPHLFYPLDDTFAVPFGRPAPASLNVAPAVADIGQAIYLASVEESIQRFAAHSATTAETRWNSRLQLGWLLFNTVLPLAGTTLGKVAWLAQMEIALAQLFESDDTRDPSGHRMAMVNLLVNIALLLLSRTAWQSRLEEGQEASLPVQSTPIPMAPLVEIDTPETTLNFHWSHASRTLSATQRASLSQLRGKEPLHTLGTPIPYGPLAGLYLARDKFWVQLEGAVYRVVLDDSTEQPRIVSDTAEEILGPWLMRDEAGRWQLDLRLRLLGGMPSGSRIARLREEKRQTLATLDESIGQATREGIEQLRAINASARTLSDDSNPEVLQSYLQSCQRASAHWELQLQRLNQYNALQPRPNFKIERANALSQRAFSERLVNLTLHRLYDPARTHLARFLEEHQAHMSPADLNIYSTRLASLSPLIDQMVANADAMHELHQEMNKLTNRGQDSIQAMFDRINQSWPSPEYRISSRYRRLENRFNRLFVLHPFKDGELRPRGFWLKRANANVALVVAQLKRLASLDHPSDELASRLLKAIGELLKQARRQLGNFKALAQDEDSLALLTRIDADLDYLQAKVHLELSEYPAYPATTTLSQLRQGTPGLIETSEHGLLLGVPHEGDASIIDIPEADGQGSTRSYRHEQDGWVEIPPAPSPQKPNDDSLKKLLKASDKLMSRARAELTQLQGTRSDSYLPVEIHDLLSTQQQRLIEQADAIERHLTADNQSDEAAGDRDAAQVTKALNDLSLSLGDQARNLRIQAALRQRPRMGEVQFLVDSGEATIHAIGNRTLLAKVKGRPADYLDEYSIRHQGQDLWYAHFHYPALDTPREQFLAGHLKTASQRHARGQSVPDPASGRAVEVYRAPVSVAAATRYFFNR